MSRPRLTFLALSRHLALGPASLVLAFSVQAASPNINVGAMYEYLEPDRSTLLKRVRNAGDATAFVRTEITEVVYDGPGKPSERALPSDQSAFAAGSAPHLIASPSRLIVPAKGQQATRLLFRGDRSKERYYRMRFVPVLPSREEFALTETESEAYRKQLSAGVNVLTGYGIFVIVHPSAPTYRTHHDDGGDSYTLRNGGNSTVVIENFVHCRGSGKAEQCSPPRKIHLLPGRTEMFEKRAGNVHRFELVEGDRRRTIHFSR
ncbi:CS1 fimbrial subunit B flags: Precursor [Stenotrophomonas sp. TWI700]|uniref:CS1 fimbrial subunit B flags: Precursor n=1 Tax=Stenotrophomonas sp. TWI700 TaxID=3136792 RepID=UPI00320BA239